MSIGVGGSSGIDAASWPSDGDESTPAEAPVETASPVVRGAAPGDRAVDILARLHAAEGSGSSLLRFVDAARNVQRFANTLGADDGTVSATDIENLVTEAKDLGGITSSERAVLLEVLGGERGTLDPAARQALAQFLGVADPLAAADLGTTAPPAAADDAGARTPAAAAAAAATSATDEAGARLNARLDRHRAFQQVRNGSRVLGRGDYGDSIADFQRVLSFLGFPCSPDGRYGARTEGQVKRFQRAHNLPQTGRLDQATLESVRTAASGRAPARPADRLIRGSVGVAGANDPADVTAVQARLKALGYFRGTVDGRYTGTLGRAIQLFDATSRNAGRVARGRRRRRAEMTLTPGESAERWLRADNAPRWQRIPASGAGWINADRDGHSHASSWLIASLNRVGARYQVERDRHPGWTAIHTNDASVARGGDTPDHASHEAGLDLDVNLGTGGLTYRSRRYNREETWAKIRAFLDDPGVKSLYFNDPVLVRRAAADPRYRGRLTALSGHDHHLHIDFKPPG